jgi:hypothetical protein
VLAGFGMWFQFSRGFSVSSWRVLLLFLFHSLLSTPLFYSFFLFFFFFTSFFIFLTLLFLLPSLSFSHTHSYLLHIMEISTLSFEWFSLIKFLFITIDLHIHTSRLISYCILTFKIRNTHLLPYFSSNFSDLIIYMFFFYY